MRGQLVDRARRLVLLVLFAFGVASSAVGQEGDISCPPKSISEISLQMQAININYKLIIDASQKQGADVDIKFGCIGDANANNMIADFILYGKYGFIKIEVFEFRNNMEMNSAIADWLSLDICDVRRCDPDIRELLMYVDNKTVKISFTRVN